MTSFEDFNFCGKTLQIERLEIFLVYFTCFYLYVTFSTEDFRKLK